MYKSSTSVGPEIRYAARVCVSTRNPWKTPVIHTPARGQGRRVLTGRFFAVLAFCLTCSFLAAIAVEAFDTDIALWQFGAESLKGPTRVASPTKGHLIHFESSLSTVVVAARVASPADGQPIQSCHSLGMLLYFEVAAGAYLIAQYRAQSGLPTDNPFHFFLPLNVAERRVHPSVAIPVLGQCVCWGQHGENRSGCARARTAHRLPLSARSGV